MPLAPESLTADKLPLLFIGEVRAGKVSDGVVVGGHLS
jgi:hypothetical protein